MNEAKIQLSPEELALVQNQQWLLTKNIIIEKVCNLFAELAKEQALRVAENPFLLIDDIWKLSPKISKGEKFKGLPYVMLDYPRCFHKEDIFAIRTLFWWGNFFSVTLHLKGKYQKLFVPAIHQKLFLLAKVNFQLSISGNEWEHDLDSENYISLPEHKEGKSPIELVDTPFYKVSCRLPISNWNGMGEDLSRVHSTIYEAIAH